MATLCPIITRGKIWAWSELVGFHLLFCVVAQEDYLFLLRRESTIL
jgi:hypothetical protein